MTEMRKKIALMVKPVWEANREECMDRGTALAMLMGNFRAEANGTEPLYSWGTNTEEQITMAREWYNSIPTSTERMVEYMHILKIVEKMDW